VRLEIGGRDAGRAERFSCSARRPALVGHLTRSPRGKRKLMENTMADEFTFLGVAAGIGVLLLMILFI
jgi:hypothetical protein